MRDGARTRENIVRQAAGLFNQRGFAGASMSDVMAATGLQKGGIYRHFESKEALALEAFDYAVRLLSERFADAVASRANAVDRLAAVVGVFESLPTDPPVPGGCPMMNAATENDDGNPALRERARHALHGLRRLVVTTVRDGIERGEVRPEVDGYALASVLLATMEGGVMLSQLYEDPEHVRRAGAFVRAHLEAAVRA